MNEIEKMQAEIRKFVAERDWQKYHSPKNLSMDLCVESAEFMEIFQWLSEEQSKNLDETQKQNAADELADVLYAVVYLADLLKIDLSKAFEIKMQKNRSKYPANQFKGSNRKYNE